MWAVARGWEPEKWAKAGLCTAKLSVESQLAVSPLVTPTLVESMMEEVE